MTARARRHTTASAEADNRRATASPRASRPARRIEALAPAGLPPAGRDWPEIRRALAGTDDDDLPLLFGRLPG